MDISVIYVNYNTSEMLTESLASLVHWTNDCSYEVIIVDNASNLEERKKLEKLKKRYGTIPITLINSDENLGFGRANNLGATYAAGDYLFFLNPDTLLIMDAISILVKFIKNESNIGAIGGQLLDTELNETCSFGVEFDSLESERRNASLMNMVNRFLGKKNNSKQSIDGFLEYKTPAYIFGADLMIPTAIYKELSGFDPDFFMYGEEQELQFRIVKGGKKIKFLPEAKIVHIDGGSFDSTSEFNPIQFKMRMQGKYLFFLKAYGLNKANEFLELRKKTLIRNQRITALLGRSETSKIYKLQHKIIKDIMEENCG